MNLGLPFQDFTRAAAFAQERQVLRYDPSWALQILGRGLRFAVCSVQFPGAPYDQIYCSVGVFRSTADKTLLVP